MSDSQSRPGRRRAIVGRPPVAVTSDRGPVTARVPSTITPTLPPRHSVRYPTDIPCLHHIAYMSTRDAIDRMSREQTAHLYRRKALWPPARELTFQFGIVFWPV